MDGIGEMLELVGKLFDTTVKLQECRKQGCLPEKIKALEEEGDRISAQIDELSGEADRVYKKAMAGKGRMQS